MWKHKLQWGLGSTFPESDYFVKANIQLDRKAYKSASFLSTSDGDRQMTSASLIFVELIKLLINQFQIEELEIKTSKVSEGN